jgi:hypothetical protein
MRGHRLPSHGPRRNGSNLLADERLQLRNALPRKLSNPRSAARQWPRSNGPGTAATRTGRIRPPRTARIRGTAGASVVYWQQRRPQPGRATAAAARSGLRGQDNAMLACHLRMSADTTRSRIEPSGRFFDLRRRGVAAHPRRTSLESCARDPGSWSRRSVRRTPRCRRMNGSPPSWPYVPPVDQVPQEVALRR